VTFRAVVREANGDPVPNGGPVIWSFDSSPSSGDEIDPAQSNTDSHGRAETEITFDCVPGDRVLRATANTISGTVVLQVHVKDQFDDEAAAVANVTSQGSSNGGSAGTEKNGAAARSTGVLPNTSAAPGASPATVVALVALLLAASLVVGRAATRRE